MQNTLKIPILKDYINLFALSAIWGTAFIGIEIAIEHLNIFHVTFGRVFIAFLFLLPIVIYKKLPFPNTKKAWLFIIIAALLNNSIPFSLINWGQQYISSGMSALMIGFGPFITLVLTHYMTKDEKFSSSKLLSLFVAFIGLFLLVGDSIVISDLTSLKGQLAVLLASFCYVMSSVIIRKIFGVSFIMISFLMFGIASISMLPIAINVSSDISGIFDNSIISIIYLGIFPTAIASLYRVQMVQKVGVQFMSQVAYLIPIFALIFAWIVLDEIPKLITLLSLILILLGLYLRNTNK